MLLSTEAACVSPFYFNAQKSPVAEAIANNTGVHSSRNFT